jgi:glycosyltransferase involved in cell wall biosynthesis
VGALAQALSTLAHDPELRRRLGQAGQRRVAEHFTQSAMAERHVALYERILEAAEK